MRYKFKAMKIKSTARGWTSLVVLLLILFSLTCCQNEEPVYFSDIAIPNFGDNCTFSSISRDNKLIAVDCDTGEESQGHAKRNLFVSNTTKIDWSPLFSDDDLPLYYLVSTFSPDARMLAVTDRHGSLWIFETKHWTNLQTFHYPWIRGNPIWSPDGKSIAVGGDGEIALSLLLPDGNYRYLLTHSDFFPQKDQINRYDHLDYLNVTWSPDGKKIAYVARIVSQDEITESQLWTLDIFSNQRKMLYQGQLGGNPAWSPDGNKIALTGSREIQVYDFQSEELITIYQVKGSPPINRVQYVSTGLWSPDSTIIVFYVYYAGECEGCDKEGIYLVNLLDMKIEIMSEHDINLIQWMKGNDLVVQNYNDANQTIITILSFASE